MMTKLQVGLIGLGAIGRMHYACWRKAPRATLVAVSARDPRKLAGEWAGQEFNLGDQSAERVDLSDLARYTDYEELIADPRVEAIDLCLPTPWHAPVAIAAMRAGKHVFCEKPMALSVADCEAMERVADETGRHLMVGHCLRYWPHYVKAKELLDAGTYGRPLSARFHRASGAPIWSGDGWFMRPEESGGVLDMHIHDVDVALWWFGQPAKIEACGYGKDGLALSVDAHWHYPAGPVVQLDSAWDLNGGAFRHAFKLVMEKATLSYDLAVAEGALQLITGGEITEIPLPAPEAHQAEIDDFAAGILDGANAARITPAESRLAVEVGLAEMTQILHPAK